MPIHVKKQFYPRRNAANPRKKQFYPRRNDVNPRRKQSNPWKTYANPRPNEFYPRMRKFKSSLHSIFISSIQRMGDSTNSIL